MLPTTEEVNSLLPYYTHIQKTILAWEERDSKDNKWLYDGARQDIYHAWKWIYRMGVRQQILEPKNDTSV